MTRGQQTEPLLSAALAETLAEVVFGGGGQGVSPSAELEAHLGIDSLALLGLVNLLEKRLDVVFPDEVTGRLRTVGDVHKALGVLCGEATDSTRGDNA